MSKLENLCFDTLTLYVSFRSHTLPSTQSQERIQTEPHTQHDTLPLTRAAHSTALRPTYCCTTPHDWCDDTAAVLVGGWLTGCRRLGFCSSCFWAQSTPLVWSFVGCPAVHARTHENMCVEMRLRQFQLLFAGRGGSRCTARSRCSHPHFISFHAVVFSWRRTPKTARGNFAHVYCAQLKGLKVARRREYTTHAYSWACT